MKRSPVQCPKDGENELSPSSGLFCAPHALQGRAHPQPGSRGSRALLATCLQASFTTASPPQVTHSSRTKQALSLSPRTSFKARIICGLLSEAAPRSLREDDSRLCCAPTALSSFCVCRVHRFVSLPPPPQQTVSSCREAVGIPIFL